ncbi:MAG: prepilin-type N-terminal cleavage/methylation domain-containing protein [Dehalococcoidia bacterium]|jgi:general secretion pathway protein G
MRKGFTLIELLIVIMVIAILIGIALPRFRGMQEEGNIAKAKGELVTLQAAVESYYMHNSNAYPAALSNLTTATPQIVDTTLPEDPFNIGNNYGYAQSPDGRYYVLYSAGAGGNGSASVADTGVITETNGTSCIYVSNAGRDTQP